MSFEEAAEQSKAAAVVGAGAPTGAAEAASTARAGSLAGGAEEAGAAANIIAGRTPARGAVAAADVGAWGAMTA